MKAKLTIQALSFEFETTGDERVPDLGTLIMPALPSALTNGDQHQPRLTAQSLPAPRQKPQIRRGPTTAKASPPAEVETLARKGSPRWELFPTRNATKDFPDCYFCHQPIHIHKHYRDGGQPHLRAHETCVAACLATRPEAHHE